ncbi:MAG: patatin-like phospholipase family protein, partial [Desulfobulbaceae bacterium]|nr:patatin-like phospholipase family protein [Desulfobulbaceae bacterium]
MRSKVEKQFWLSVGRLAVICLLLAVVGCAGAPTRKSPVPAQLISKVGIEGIPEARFWGDEWPRFSIERFATFSSADFQKFFPGVYNKPHNYLAISGGGANGAFGAGLFAGWTAFGTRPEFFMVTGISTGALTAPFAFLGSEYDALLKQVYTTTSTKDIMKKRGIISAIFSDSMADTTPLKKLLAKYVTIDVVKAIAREHRRGRRLYVGTVNLDAGRSVIWSIGAIAASDHPGKLELIHEILRASAAIPVAFPPIAITVENNGRKYEELHVDGGTGSQGFVYPASADWKQITKKLKAQGNPKVYVIRNSFMEPDYQGINRSLVPIANRSIDSLIRTQGVGDLYQIFALCKRDGNDFNLAYIPETFTEEPSEGFDPVYMGKLYELGYQMALKGY